MLHDFHIDVGAKKGQRRRKESSKKIKHSTTFFPKVLPGMPCVCVDVWQFLKELA